MSYEQVVDRIRFLIYGDAAWRVNVLKDADEKPYIVLNAHGMTVAETRKMINDIVRLIYCDTIGIKVIHGFNHGTAIKDMIASESFGDRLVRKYTPGSNPGVTYMEFAS